MRWPASHRGNSSVCAYRLSNWLRNQAQTHQGPLSNLFFASFSLLCPFLIPCCGCYINAWRSIACLWLMTNGAALYFIKINESIFPLTLITSYSKLPFALRQIPLMKTTVRCDAIGIQSLLPILALTYRLHWLSDWEGQTAKKRESNRGGDDTSSDRVMACLARWPPYHKLPCWRARLCLCVYEHESCLWDGSLEAFSLQTVSTDSYMPLCT